MVSGCVAGPRLELQHNKQTKEEEEVAEKENREHRAERESESRVPTGLGDYPGPGEVN